jgi:hypothetical protein
MATRLECHDKRSVPGSFARCVQGMDLGMRPAVVLVPTFSGQVAVAVKDDRSDHGIRFDAPTAAGGERKCGPHPVFNIWRIVDR